MSALFGAFEMHLCKKEKEEENSCPFFSFEGLLCKSLIRKKDIREECHVSACLTTAAGRCASPRMKGSGGLRSH